MSKQHKNWHDRDGKRTYRRRYPTHVPPDTLCSKCGKPIKPGTLYGRRFRMKYRHKECLPATRRDKINWTLPVEAKTNGEESEL